MHTIKNQKFIYQNISKFSIFTHVQKKILNTKAGFKDYLGVAPVISPSEADYIDYPEPWVEHKSIHFNYEMRSMYPMLACATLKSNYGRQPSRNKCMGRADKARAKDSYNG